MDDHKTAVSKLMAALDFEREIVGIRFLFTEQEYAAAEANQAKGKIPYCVMVKAATLGYALKTTLETSGCAGGTRALGLEEASASFQSGCEYQSFGLYQDLAIAKNVVNNITFCQHKIFGVMAKPLKAYTEKPDVVLIITNAQNAMRIIQGYTYKYGTQPNFKISGNQAICAESTAYPFESNSINVSMLCSGTRYLAGWGENELAIGLPYGKFLETADGVYLSINGSEQNHRKAVIREKLAAEGLEDPGIFDDDAYFIRLSKKPKADEGVSAKGDAIHE